MHNAGVIFLIFIRFYIITISTAIYIEGNSWVRGAKYGADEVTSPKIMMILTKCMKYSCGYSKYKKI